jgi:hemolysin activation/secretion protein
MNLFFSGPKYTQYFYGLGNTYVDYDQKKNYHIVSGSQIEMSPSVSKRFGIGNSISLTPTYQFINIEDDSEEPRFIYTPASGLGLQDFGNRHYLGATVSYQFSRLDNAGYPSRGLELGSWIGGRSSLTGESFSHGVLGAEASLYLPFDVAGTVVLATHVGADKVLGDYEFFHALTLGGPQHVRGFRTDRFAGDARFYQATDLRLKLLNKRGVVPFQLGLYVAFDYGRVWYEDDLADTDDWHTAVGGGLFIVPLGVTAFRVGYMVGEDDKQLTIGGALRF